MKEFWSRLPLRKARIKDSAGKESSRQNPYLVHSEFEYQGWKVSWPVTGSISGALYESLVLRAESIMWLLGATSLIEKDRDQLIDDLSEKVLECLEPASIQDAGVTLFDVRKDIKERYFKLSLASDDHTPTLYIRAGFLANQPLIRGALGKYFTLEEMSSVLSGLRTLFAKFQPIIEGDFFLPAEVPNEQNGRYSEVEYRPEAPVAQPYGVSGRGAEEWVADWLRHLGFESVLISQGSWDGGIDISTDEVVVQVKNWDQRLVSVEVLHAIVGVASVARKMPVLATQSELTAAAIKFAEEASVAVIKYNPMVGFFAPANASAAILLNRVEESRLLRSNTHQTYLRTRAALYEFLKTMRSALQPFRALAGEIQRYQKHFDDIARSVLPPVKDLYSPVDRAIEQIKMSRTTEDLQAVVNSVNLYLGRFESSRAKVARQLVHSPSELASHWGIDSPR